MGPEFIARVQKMTAEQLREAVALADGVIVRSGYKLTAEILKDQPRLNNSSFPVDHERTCESGRRMSGSHTP